MAEDYPVRTPIRRSLLRPLLMLGGERELVALPELREELQDRFGPAFARYRQRAG